MTDVLVWLALYAMQAAYGPAVPADPAPAAATTAVDPQSSLELVLRAQGLSEAGLTTLRSVPLPSIARGATRAAQCAVEQLRDRDPLAVADLIGAMNERDATAAAQAQARTRYLATVLPRLIAADQRVLLAVLGDGAAIGGEAPPRPERARHGDGAPPRDGPGDRGVDRPATSFGGPRGRIAGADRGARRDDRAPAMARARIDGPESPCERYLAD